MVGESYQHVNDNVLPLRTPVSTKRPEYFVRTIKDHGALDYGLAMELPAMIGAHPPEDVMHLGSWIQLFTILSVGVKPKAFQCLPNYNGRPPELVRGRIYPLVSVDGDVTGTLCLAPETRFGAYHLCVSRMLDTGERSCEVHPLKPIGDWFKFVVCASKFMVAPLVFRRHALFRGVGGEQVPYVAVDFMTPSAPRTDPASTSFPVIDANTPVVHQFLSHTGNYTLSQGAGMFVPVHFTDAHERLVPLGAYILVPVAKVAHFGISASKEMLRGSLRYPDEAEDTTTGNEFQYHVYITIREKTKNDTIIVRVIYAHVRDCIILEGSNIAASEYAIVAFAATVQI
jgi:hypothetical protein